MEGTALEKVPKGKLLRIKVNFDKTITDVQITGDFFAHPENSIDNIEKLLTGLPLNFDKEQTLTNLSKFINDNNYELIGINSEAILRVLQQAIK